MTDERFPDGEAAPKSGRASRLIYNDYTLAGIIAALCALFYYFSTLIPLVPPALAQGMQPASFPQGVIVTILGMVAFMLFENRGKPLDPPQRIPALAFKVMASMVFAVALATWFDFLLALVAFIALNIPMWGIRRPVLALAYALVFVAVLFTVFSMFLQVRFPMGAFTHLLY